MQLRNKIEHLQADAFLTEPDCAQYHYFQGISIFACDFSPVICVSCLYNSFNISSGQDSEQFQVSGYFR